jgi:uncharacterized protein YaaN involved in tellurite resistance
MNEILQESNEEFTADQKVLRQELNLIEPDSVTYSTGTDPELEKSADEVVSKLLSVDATDERERSRAHSSIENLAIEVQKKAVLKSEKLKDPIRKMTIRSEEGSDVANALVDLRVQVESLDPARFDFDPGWLTRIMGYLPGIGTPMKRYFSRYESAQTVINAIVTSLEQGREQLKRDNITLLNDQNDMRDATEKLTRAIQLAQLIDRKLEGALQNDVSVDDPKYNFIQDELMFPLRQRIMDLQQQLAVNQQGILSMEIIIRNNKELVRGVNRALNVTISALRVAVTVALALADQKIVLEKVQALSSTTSGLIANTAQRLKTQGVEIHKAASSTKLDMTALESAFADIRTAMQDVSDFRRKALPEMKRNIETMDRLTAEAEDFIEKKEKARNIEPVIPIEID